MFDDIQNLSDHELHMLAGLMPAGRNDEGIQLWIGTDKAWNEYQSLEKMKQSNS